MFYLFLWLYSSWFSSECLLSHIHHIGVEEHSMEMEKKIIPFMECTDKLKTAFIGSSVTNKSVRMVQNVLVILWKDLLMRKNHCLATASEIFIPVGLIILANISLQKSLYEINNDLVFFDGFKANQCTITHSHYESILFEPSTPFTEDLMSKAACYAGYKPKSVKSGNINWNNTGITIGIKFNIPENTTGIPNNLNYSIYPKHEVWIQLNKLWRISEISVPRYTIPLLRNVIEIQRAIDVSYMDLKNITAPMVNLENTDFFDRSPRIFSVAIYLAFFLGFSLMVPPIISRVIQEKYTGAKEMMLMMGVKKWELWVAKFIDSFFFQILTVSGMTLFVYIPLKEESNVLNIPPLILWSVVLYGLIGVITFLFFLSCFFKKSSLAVYVSEIIWSCSFIFNNFISSFVELPIFIKFFMCLFPHVTLMNGISILLDFDYYGKQIKFTEKLSGSEDYLTLSDVLLCMSLNIIIYSVLTWYLEHVKPGQYGIPQPYNFCFKKSYWLPDKCVMLSNTDCIHNDTFPSGFEVVPSNLKNGIHIERVSKIFKSIDKGHVIAVDKVTIDFYHGEISAVLGHNGAGKSTMFSMISGLIQPTSGRVLINDYDLAVNIKEARSSLGLCPQKDMLFNDLTILQILKFYGVIKGLKLQEANQEAQDLIKKLKLTDVKNIQTRNLSGGQKRKVSLAIALIGGSEVLILDEPTSGMDPEIRREIWEILLKFRGSRTILITTHFMEEADALCDRIAIMDCGKIKCYGSPMFLKSKYGKGYVLSLVVPDIDNYKDVSELVMQYVPSARFKSQNIRTVSYELPENEVTKFPSLFSELDEKQMRHEIISYGVSVATLEDVFLKLRRKSGSTEDFDTTDSARYIQFLNSQNSELQKVLGIYLYAYQLWALLIKNWILFKRQFNIFLLYSLLAGLLVASTTLLSNNQGGQEKSLDLNSRSPIAFSTDLYAPFQILYSNLGNDSAVKAFPDFIKTLNCDIREVSKVKEEIRKIYERDFYEYARKTNLGVKFSTNEITLYQNDRAVHMVPIALNLIHNFILKIHNANSTIVTFLNVKYAAKERIFKPQAVSKCILGSIPDFSGIQTLFYFLAPLKEEILGAKDIQLMIAPTISYWFSYLLFDTVSFVVYMIVICLWFGLTEGSLHLVEYGGEIFGSLLLWGIGMILLAYLIASTVKNEAGAFTTSLIVYIIFTFILNNPISTLSLPEFVHYLHPTCILKNGYTNLCIGENGGNYIVVLFFYDIILFSILLVKDSNIFPQITHFFINKIVAVNYLLENEDDNLVKEEKTEVENIVQREQTSRFALVVRDLKRWYLKSLKLCPSVRGISFAVKEGECFGLLGVNGAGKTSTFKMLTGTIPSSGGEIFIHSKNLTVFNKYKCLYEIGYCPQYGGLIPTFKGSELLRFFARLRGVSRMQLDVEVSNWLERLNLHDFADQNCGTYSGGNQRKLSTAISLVGDSRLIFLDEPTSGVDPASRRSMWNIIDEVQKQGRSVVLTSHCMDECEALCSRLAIMVKGRFRCLGEITTLKNKFGQGYSIQLKVSCTTSSETIQLLKESFKATFNSSCKLVDEHLTVLQYHVPKKFISWARLFSKLKVLKDNFDALESYTASETTLEEIFIYLARNQ